MAAAVVQLSFRPRSCLSWLVSLGVVGIEPISRRPSQASLATLLSGRQIFIVGLGIGQIISWGTLYYSFPLIAERMANDLGFSKPEVYGAATVGLLIAGFTAYPIGVAIDGPWPGSNDVWLSSCRGFITDVVSGHKSLDAVSIARRYRAGSGDDAL